jgi:hypothetical protein
MDIKNRQGQKRFSETVQTEIYIHASPELVWSVLSDLQGYREWNPMIRRASGELKQGKRLNIYFNPEGSKGRTFRPKLLVVDPGYELRWQGQPGVPLLFESEHIFIIEQAGEGRSRLIHDMIFYGLLIPLARSKIVSTVKGHFNDMNLALKDRVEQNQAGK